MTRKLFYSDLRLLLSRGDNLAVTEILQIMEPGIEYSRTELQLIAGISKQATVKNLNRLVKRKEVLRIKKSHKEVSYKRLPLQALSISHFVEEKI